MNEMENLALNEGAENVEATATEETVGQVESVPEKVYTEEEFNSKLDEVIGKKLARREAKLRKEYDRKYGRLEEVLKAGTGKESVEEVTDTFEQFYTSKGVEIPKQPTYSSKDIEVLARAEADEVIRGGFEDVIEEAERLQEIGVENMTAREKAVFLALTEHIKATDTSREFAKIGVGADVYESKEFKEFAAMFKSDIPMTKVYEAYIKSQPKKEIKPMGSIKNTTADTGTVKDYYSYEEAIKFTKADFDKNPALYEAVQNSMRKWSKK
jgi:5-methylcytosine-specific restriction endonuclease McrBC regulatory subunit McrC